MRTATTDHDGFATGRVTEHDVDQAIIIHEPQPPTTEVFEQQQQQQQRANGRRPPSRPNVLNPFDPEMMGTSANAAGQGYFAEKREWWGSDDRDQSC